jgi:hypothetical protein
MPGIQQSPCKLEAWLQSQCTCLGSELPHTHTNHLSKMRFKKGLEGWGLASGGRMLEARGLISTSTKKRWEGG